VLQSLFDLTERGGDLEAAESALRESLRAKALPKAEATRKRAVVLLERAESARAAGDSTAANASALGHAREAHKLAPDLVPASALLAQLLLEGGEARKAAKVLEEAWARAPHPDLAALYLKARSSDDSLERLKSLGKLVARNTNHVESHLVRGRAALEARLWGETRRHLEAAAGPGGLDAGQPREAVCRLMAELEEAERADVDLAHSWLTRAATAPPDPLWVCADCGASAEGWSARCGNCASFDALAWTAPPRVAAAQEIAAPGEQAGLPALTAPKSVEEEAAGPPAVIPSS
jgi:HemY protein